MSKRERREKRDKVKAHLEKRLEGTKRPWAEWDPKVKVWRIRQDVRKRMFWIGMLILWIGAGIFLIAYLVL